MPGAVVMPGIVDAHHQVEQPFAKAVSLGEPAQMWKRLGMPLASIHTPETAYVAADWTSSGSGSVCSSLGRDLTGVSQRDSGMAAPGWLRTSYAHYNEYCLLIDVGAE